MIYSIEEIIDKYRHMQQQMAELKSNPANYEALSIQIQKERIEFNSTLKNSFPLLNKYVEEKTGIDIMQNRSKKTGTITKDDFMDVFVRVKEAARNKKMSKQISDIEYEQLSDIMNILNDYYMTTLADKRRVSKKLVVGITALVVVLLIAGNFLILKLQNTEKVSSLSNIPPPIQIETTGFVEMKNLGNSLRLEYIAEYTITGRVVETASFFGTKNYNFRGKFSPRDVGIAWGPLSDKSVDEYITWTKPAFRTLYFTSRENWIDSLGGMDVVSSSFSNNHLIPANTKIRNLIRMIKKNDYIRIEGYLVNAFYMENNEMVELFSSTSRYDSGDGACEQIYVTNVTWLKK